MSSTPHLLWSGSGWSDVYYSYAFYSSVISLYYHSDFVSLLRLAIISSRRYWSSHVLRKRFKYGFWFWHLVTSDDLAHDQESDHDENITMNF